MFEQEVYVVHVCMQERNGMEPSVSIHHFVHPAWFEALGGWTKEENIDLYVKFAVEAFKRFGKHAETWSSFNEPTVSCGPIKNMRCFLYLPPVHLLDASGTPQDMSMIVNTIISLLVTVRSCAGTCYRRLHCRQLPAWQDVSFHIGGPSVAEPAESPL